MFDTSTSSNNPSNLVVGELLEGYLLGEWTSTHPFLLLKQLHHELPAKVQNKFKTCYLLILSKKIKRSYLSKARFLATYRTEVPLKEHLLHKPSHPAEVQKVDHGLRKQVEDDGGPGFAAIQSTMGFAQEVTPGSALMHGRYTCTAHTTSILLCTYNLNSIKMALFRENGNFKGVRNQ